MPVFGHTQRERNPGQDRELQPEWNDAAAEEIFSRLWNNSTVRSRHFRVLVTGQTIKESRSGEKQVLATRTRVFHVFIRPLRNEDGSLARQVMEVTYSRSL